MTCLCGEKQTTLLFQSGLYDVLRCTACGQVHIEAPRGAKRTGYYKEEDVQFYVNHQTMFRRLFHKMLVFIRPYAPRGTIVDVGAGVGLFLDEARKIGYKVIGFEPSKASVVAAKTHFGIDLVNAEFRVTDGVDIIVINHVLEHLANPDAVIRRCAKTLGQGGTLVIGVPNFGSFMRLIKRGKWQSLIPREHRWQFSLQTLDRLVLSHGFRRIAVSYENHDRSMHPSWKKPIYALLDRIALWTGFAEAMLVIYKKT